MLFGLLLLFAPGLSFKLLRLQTSPDHPEAVAEARGTMSGFYLGLGLCCLLLAQPLLYLALGFSWLFTAFGRIVSMMSDRGNTLYNWASLASKRCLPRCRWALPSASYSEFKPACAGPADSATIVPERPFRQRVAVSKCLC